MNRAVKEITIPKLERRAMTVAIVGTSALICSRFSEERRQEIETKQQGKARTAKLPRVPETEFEQAVYRMKDGKPGFPARGIKKALVGAGRMLDLPMTQLRLFVQIPADLLEIEGPPPVMRSDMGRLASGVFSPAYRPEFFPWKIRVPVVYLATKLSQDELISLFMHAGFGPGLGAWRAECNGTFGTFDVAEVEDAGEYVRYPKADRRGENDG